MANNGTIEKTVFTDGAGLSGEDEVLVKAIHVSELQEALRKLNDYVQNVDNCGNCAFCQVCQRCQIGRAHV